MKKALLILKMGIFQYENRKGRFLYSTTTSLWFFPDKNLFPCFPKLLNSSLERSTSFLLILMLKINGIQFLIFHFADVLTTLFHDSVFIWIDSLVLILRYVKLWKLALLNPIQLWSPILVSPAYLSTYEAQFLLSFSTMLLKGIEFPSLQVCFRLCEIFFYLKIVPINMAILLLKVLCSLFLEFYFLLNQPKIA